MKSKYTHMHTHMHLRKARRKNVLVLLFCSAQGSAIVVTIR